MKRKAEEENKKISYRITKIREGLEITKTEMADKLNISKQTFGQLEFAKRKLQISELQILMNHFNINPIWVISGEGKMHLEDNYKVVELTNLILDFRNYGGEVDIVIREIVKKILEKLFLKKKLLKIIPLPISIFSDHVLYALMQIIAHSDFTDDEQNAKNYFRDRIELFDKAGGPAPSEIKKTLYAMLEKINNKDCFYLLKHKKIAAEQILSKVTSIDQRLNNLFIKKDRDLHKFIKNLD